MRKTILLILLAIACVTVSAKTTYIPTYRALIQMYGKGMDTLSVQNKLELLEMISVDSSFRISIVHEDVTKEKVKAIKRAKAAEGWMTFATVMSGVSAGLSRYRLSFHINMKNTMDAAFLTEMLNMGAKSEQTLGIEVWLGNLGDHELLAADMDRGLTWFVQPHSTLQLNLANPGIENLRVSDLHHQNVQFVTAVACSSVDKETIEWEDDECWIVSHYTYDDSHAANRDEANTYKVQLYGTTPVYHYISKESFESCEMTAKEVKDYKKLRKTLSGD